MVDPRITPASLVQLMVFVWPNMQETHAALIREARSLILNFLPSVQSASFATLTIAMSALLLAFFKMKMDPADWLSYLPDSCKDESAGADPYRSVDRYYFLLLYNLLPEEIACVFINRLFYRCILSFGDEQSALRIATPLVKEVTEEPRDPSPTGIADMFGIVFFCLPCIHFIALT